ncbi:sugar ABC transporter ATP-binding protein [Fimbriimonas ginsengisoli]|uniref:ABC transporter-like protein n=1 Tax=Fimbriimonas ginsengisoli Gsoil 348 TaxID=661478 RepID=A0A068NRE9_FIMGI|nr:sugar ABC transporter ATP-binding protein [Fimbriimonas ginsengisoli]AIE86088.1 ABC transporter-like protein [Fimbriimonas ginsengisoli Gsoil 348]
MQPILEVRGLTKTFPAVKALDGVDLSVLPGEVHGIVGENGAGKSTLMKILSGIYPPSSGELFFEGAPTAIRNPAAAIRMGIAMIHQELNLVDELSVADNLFLGQERTKAGRIDRGRTRLEADDLLAQVKAGFPSEARVGDLSIAGKQLVEIAKALSYKAKVIIMDEPTAVLSEAESSALFSLMSRLKQDGVAILFISHHLREVREHCDRITVLRDGRLVATFHADAATEGAIARMMVGRELADLFPPKSVPSAGTVLKVTGLRLVRSAPPFDLEIRAGEIVGLAGLVGSGRTEVAEAIVGLRPKVGGEIEVGGQAVSIRRPIDAMRCGLAYVSEDRKERGLVLGMDTVQNVTLANLRRYAHPVVRKKEESAAVAAWVEKLDIRAGDLHSPTLYLSGGNQQKVAVAKWLDTRPKVLLLDEPTRGIDIGAKREMYELIQNLAADGMACLVISSEMPELLGLCHRILVMRSGQIVGTATTEEEIMRLAAGLEPLLVD